MKLVVLLFTLLSITACDPYGFGFKKNPAYVIGKAFEAVQNLDVDKFIEMSGEEALCVYGNVDGLSLLRGNTALKKNEFAFAPQKLVPAYLSSPKFVGFWSYYSEDYLIDILEKDSQELILQLLVECNYGNSGKKDEKFHRLKPSKYKKRECLIVKIIPKRFKERPFPAKCAPLKVTL